MKTICNFFRKKWIWNVFRMFILLALFYLELVIPKWCNGTCHVGDYGGSAYCGTTVER